MGVFALSDSDSEFSIMILPAWDGGGEGRGGGFEIWVDWIDWIGLDSFDLIWFGLDVVMLVMMMNLMKFDDDDVRREVDEVKNTEY